MWLSRGQAHAEFYFFCAHACRRGRKMQREESWPSSSSLLLLICSAFIIVHLLHVCLITFLILLGSLYLCYASLSFLPRHRPSSAGFVCVVVRLTLGRELGPILFGKTTGAGFADPRGVRPILSRNSTDFFCVPYYYFIRS